MTNHRGRLSGRVVIVAGLIIAAIGFAAPGFAFLTGVPTSVGFTLLIGGPSLLIVGLVTAAVGLMLPTAGSQRHGSPRQDPLPASKRPR